MQIQHKTVTASATKGARAGTNVFTLSTNELDRDRDRILQHWNLDAFRQNPVVLFGHDKSALPIGKCTDIRVVNGKLTGTVEWPPHGCYAFADQVHALVEQGFLRAASVGFTSEDSRPNQHGGNDIHACTLLEWSIVNLPSNTSATLQRSAPTMQFKSWMSGRSESVLRLTDSPSPQGGSMRYGYDNHNVALRLKDDTMPDQSTNWEEVRRLLMAAARKVDSTYSSQELETLCAQLIRDMQRDTAPTVRDSNDYLRKLADESNEKFADEQRAKRWGQEVAAGLATPASKRIMPGFAKVY